MSQDQNNTGTTAFSGRASVPSGAAPSAGVAGGDNFLSSLAELENRISSLKAMHEQATTRDIEYSDRERMLAEREAALNVKESSLAEREASIAAKDAEIAGREQAVAQAAERVDKLRAELDERSRSVATRAEEVCARESMFAQRESAIVASEHALAERERTTQAQMQAAQVQIEEARKARDEVDMLARQVAEREAVLADENAAMMRREDSIEMKIEGAERLREQIMSRGAEIAAREAKIARELAELNARSAQFERQSSNRQAAIERAEVDLTERERSLFAKAVKAEAELARIAGEQEELDSTRGELDAARAQIQTERAKLDAKRAELDAKSDANEAAQAEINAIRDEVEKARIENERRDKDITDRAGALADGRAAFEAEQKEAADRIRADEEALAHREDQVREREIDLASAKDELDRERAGVAEHARTLAAQLKAADDDQAAAIWNNRVEHMQMELGQATADRARLETEVSQLRQSIESVTQELIESNMNRGVPEAEVQTRERRISELSAALEESRAIAGTMQERIATLEKAAKDAEEARSHDGEEHKQEAKAQAGRLAAITRERDEATRRAEKADAEKGQMVARAEFERLETELEAARELLEQADADVQSRVPVEEVVKRNEVIAKLEQAVKDAESAAGELAQQAIEEKDSIISDLRQRLEHLTTEATGPNSPVARELARVSDEVEELRSRLREAENALSEATEAAAATAGTPVEPAGPDERDEIIADLRAQLDAAAQADVGSTRADAESNAEVVELRARLDEALAQVDAIRAEQPTSEAETEAGPSGPTPAELLRRDRLRRYKSLLQTQAKKIVTAQTALQRRHSDCELILTNRSRLAELAQQLARAEKRVSASKARGGTVSALLYLVATIAILAGLSWETARRIWPGVYIARCVIDADAGRRTPSADDLDQWQKDHKEMLADPRLMEMTAERMQRRGLAQTADAAGLAARLKEDMYVQSARPGSLTVELRGEGAERTALYLDTFATTYKAFADQSRDERTNDIGVTIAQAATPGNEPLLDKRIEKAGAVFGGALLATGLAGLVIWTRLVRAKRKFDHASAVSAALEEVDWGTLEASIKQHSAKGAQS